MGETTGITVEKSTPQKIKSPADGGDEPGQQKIFIFFIFSCRLKQPV